MRPRDGTASMRWARCTTTVGPHGATVGSSDDGPTPGDAAPDPWVLGRLQELDRRFVGWLPGFGEAHGPELWVAEEMLARRRSYRPARVAWPTLPASVVRRAVACRELSPGRIYIEDDVDGLAVLLGREAHVTVSEPDHAWRAWLVAEAERAGRSDAVVVAADPALHGTCDLAVVHAGAPVETRAALARAMRATRAGGRVAVCVRSPWHAVFWPWVEAAGLRVVAHHHEVDHAFIPPGWVVEGAGDVVVLERPSSGPDGEPGAVEAETRRAQPYLLLDIDGLAPDKLEPAVLTRLADLLAAIGPRPEAARHGAVVGVVELLRWCDEGGAGLTLELHRDVPRLRVVLVPHDDGLAHAALHAALQTVGDATTRLRPPRTVRAPARGSRHDPMSRTSSPEKSPPRERSRPASSRPASSPHEPSMSAPGPCDPPPYAPAPARALCHLADGLVLVVDGARGELVDVRSAARTKLDPAASSLLADAAGGTALDPRLHAWLERGVLAPGPAAADPVLRDGLAMLDRPHLESFVQHLDAPGRAAYEAVLTAHAQRKTLVSSWSQCPVLPETALRRALLVGDARRVGPRRIVCVGDGDLVSVALAALGHEVTVLDVDERILALVGRVTAALGLAVTLDRRDLLDPLPDARRGRFDVFLTDPVSSRDSFDVFVSRALELVGPTGRGWVAVSGRASRTFETLAHAWGLRVVGWHARHNRYYAPTLRLHAYESDWVEVEKAAATRVRWPAGVRATPVELYRDGLEREAPVLLSFFDAIEGSEHTRGLFLDMLLDVAGRQGGLRLGERHRHTTRDWSVVFAATAHGHLTVHVDRARRQLAVALTPLDERAADALHRVITAGHKSQARSGQVSTGDGFCDLRVL